MIVLIIIAVVIFIVLLLGTLIYCLRAVCNGRRHEDIRNQGIDYAERGGRKPINSEITRNQSVYNAERVESYPSNHEITCNQTNYNLERDVFNQKYQHITRKQPLNNVYRSERKPINPEMTRNQSVYNAERVESYPSNHEITCNQTYYNLESDICTEVPEIDLHGMTVKEAIQNTSLFLEQYQYGCTKVKIITGRGIHSPNGIPKIKPAIIEILNEKEYEYIEINKGGSLFVTL